MEWIRVDERLPDIEDCYLVYPRKYHDTAAFHKFGTYAGKWTVDDSNGYECEVVVTHWMPLPEPPEKE